MTGRPAPRGPRVARHRRPGRPDQVGGRPVGENEVRDDDPNVLADRYASAELVAIWSPEEKVRTSAGCGSPCSAPSATSAWRCRTASSRRTSGCSTTSTWPASRERERVTRHDVKARIEEFSALAGHEHIHKGMTSRDLTENVEQLQIRASLELIRDRMVAALARLAGSAVEYSTW